MKIHDVVVIGAGQAGLAISYRLSHAGIEHVVLEKGKIGNAWQVDRWDSFCLVTPNWTITLPGAEYGGDKPYDFMGKKDFIQHLRSWADSFKAPVLEGIEVKKLRFSGGHFILETNMKNFQTKQVVVATATHQSDKYPDFLNKIPNHIYVLSASRYKNPPSLPRGGVLIIGSGQSGCQIAEELNAFGLDVFLSIGRSGRLPRRYRGRDCIEWQRDMGGLDRTPAMLADPIQRFWGDPHLTGSNGGRTLSLHELRANGVKLCGRLLSVEGTKAVFAADVVNGIDFSDKYATDFRTSVDEFVYTFGLNVPKPSAEEMLGDRQAGVLEPEPIKSIDLVESGISTIISATGFKFDFSWIELPILDVSGYPITVRGLSKVAGLNFLGLNWMVKRKSGIIYGIAEDSQYLAGRIIENYK